MTMFTDNIEDAAQLPYFMADEVAEVLGAKVVEHGKFHCIETSRGYLTNDKFEIEARKLFGD